MAAQALAEWRDSMGALAWVILGLVLALGVVAAAGFALWLLRTRNLSAETHSGDHKPDSQNLF